MSIEENPVNIPTEMTTFNSDVKVKPDNVKCTECKSVLTDACQVSCGCRFCRTCIIKLMAGGDQFCPGGLQGCAGWSLSTAVPDDNADKITSTLTAKCPQSDYLHENALTELSNHLRLRPRKSANWPFRELKCQTNKSADDEEEMSGQLEQENRSRSDSLAELVTNMNKDITVLKEGNEASREEIEVLKRELELKDQQMMTIMDEMRQVQNEIKSIKKENKSIKMENRSIKRDRELLSDQVKQLSERLERTILARCRIDELDKEISAARSGEETHAVEQDITSIRGRIECASSQVQSAPAPTGPLQVDARCDDWVIDVDMASTDWGVPDGRRSATFRGATHPLTFQLASYNCANDRFGMYLCVLPGLDEPLPQGPFRAAVAVTVAHRSRREACRWLAQSCKIEMPGEYQCGWSGSFIFWHFQLQAAGLDLADGVRVSCQVIPLS